MRCYCCSTKKKFLESFAKLNAEAGDIYLCSVCNQLLYKIRDDYNNHNVKKYNRHLNELHERKHNPHENYLKWEYVFLNKYTL